MRRLRAEDEEAQVLAKREDVRGHCLRAPRRGFRNHEWRGRSTRIREAAGICPPLAAPSSSTKGVAEQPRAAAPDATPWHWQRQGTPQSGWSDSYDTEDRRDAAHAERMKQDGETQ